MTETSHHIFVILSIVPKEERAGDYVFDGVITPYLVRDLIAYSPLVACSMLQVARHGTEA